MTKTCAATVLLLLLSAIAQARQLVRVTMLDIISLLHEKDIPVCFEQAPNRESDAITIKEQIRSIESIPQSRRSKRENEILASLRKSLKGGSVENAIIAWRMKKFNVDIDYHDSVATILNAATAEDTGYTWKKIGKRYVVYPKRNSFNRPVDKFVLKDASFEELVSLMTERVDKPAHLGFSIVQTCPGRTLGEGQRFNLTLKKTDSFTVLCAISESLGRSIDWIVLSTGQGPRHFQFEGQLFP